MDDTDRRPDPTRQRGRLLSIAAIAVLILGMVLGGVLGPDGAGAVQALVLVGFGLAVAGTVMMAVGRRREGQP